MSEIVLYVNKSDDRQLNKTLARVTSFDKIKLLENTSVLEPTILLERNFNISDTEYRNFTKCNYAYLSSTCRYYFIKDYKLLKGGIVAINLKCDVLQSFASEISDLSGLVLRNEFNTTPYYVDNDLPFLSGRMIERKEVSNSFFTNANFTDESHCITLTVTGGN